MIHRCLRHRERDIVQKFVCPRALWHSNERPSKTREMWFYHHHFVKYMKHSLHKEITLAQSKGHLELLDIDQIVWLLNSTQRFQMTAKIWFPIRRIVSLPTIHNFVHQSWVCCSYYLSLSLVCFFVQFMFWRHHSRSVFFLHSSDQWKKSTLSCPKSFPLNICHHSSDSEREIILSF